MTESIHFPERKIPEVCALIRRGLEGETDKDLIRNLNMQIKALEKYWSGLLDVEPQTAKVKR